MGEGADSRQANHLIRLTEGLRFVPVQKAAAVFFDEVNSQVFTVRQQTDAATMEISVTTLHRPEQRPLE
jgi:hypothetical protein